MSVTIEPGSFLRRYQAGEHEAVWADMTALGAAVRSAPYMDDAWAVARETMRRARSNVETLIRRLDALGYQFWNGEQGTLGPKGMLVSLADARWPRPAARRAQRSASTPAVSPAAWAGTPRRYSSGSRG